MNSIYALVCPNTNEVRYVGKTCRLESRLREHIKEARLNKPGYKTRWIRSIGLKPIFEVLQSGLSDAEVDGWERWWIADFRAHGARLTNLTDGGEGTRGAKHSEDARERHRLAALGRKNSGWKHTDKARAKIRESKLGKKRSAEYCQKMSLERRQPNPSDDALKTRFKRARRRNQLSLPWSIN